MLSQAGSGAFIHRTVAAETGGGPANERRPMQNTQPESAFRLRPAERPPLSYGQTMKVSQQQMNLILMAVEHGYREAGRGKNLEGALAGVFDLYEVAQQEG